ncbi:MAG TPA: aminopeptidase [Candidatus Nanopelagicaceae bacterium]|nr:aminopeptidase [Candidatus Nanopelagicaceae bacterium]
MVELEKIKECAKNIVKAINIQKKGENVLVRGGIYSQDLLEEIALEVYRNNGIPVITSNSDYYNETIFQDSSISSEILEITPLPYLKMIENIDAYIVIEPDEDPGVRSRAPREKLNAKNKYFAPIRDVLYGGKKEYAPGKKWCYAGWPSIKAANYYNIEYELLEKFIVGGTSIPQEQMNDITEKLGKNFENAKIVYVTDDLGTDFSVNIQDRAKILDNGLLSDDQIALGLLGGNLPAGEVFFPPHEKMGEGTLFCPLTRDRLSNKIIKNVYLKFKDGQLLFDEVTADENLDDLINTFKEGEKIDREKNVPEVRTYNVAELGIGCNPEITKAIGYILTDEKINGSIHLAFGSNTMMGGTSVSQVHWDFVTAPQANITVEYKNGTKKQIMENGKLI